MSGQESVKQLMQGSFLASKAQAQAVYRQPCCCMHLRCSTAACVPCFTRLDPHCTLRNATRCCRKRQEAAQADTKHRERQAAHHQREVALRRQPEQREHATAGVEGRHPLEVVTPAQAKYRREFRDANAVCLSTEIEQGNVEYKYMLTACITNENRRHQLVSASRLVFWLVDCCLHCSAWFEHISPGRQQPRRLHSIQDMTCS
jgi:hypothetical protein